MLLEEDNSVNYDEVYTEARKIVRYYTLDWNDADEIVQRVVVSIFEKGAFDYRGDGSFKNYLRVIVRNKFIDYIREKLRTEELKKKKMFDMRERKHRQELCDKALGEYQEANDLSDRQREILEMRADGFSTKTIAHKLDIEQSSVRSHIHRMREKIL